LNADLPSIKVEGGANNCVTLDPVPVGRARKATSPYKSRVH